MHRFALQAKHVIECPRNDVVFQEGEEIDCYEGFKYGPEEMAQQFRAAGLKEYARWKGPHDDICKHFIAWSIFLNADPDDRSILVGWY